MKCNIRLYAADYSDKEVVAVATLVTEEGLLVLKSVETASPALQEKLLGALRKNSVTQLAAKSETATLPNGEYATFRSLYPVDVPYGSLDYWREVLCRLREERLRFDPKDYQEMVAGFENIQAQPQATTIAEAVKIPTPSKPRTATTTLKTRIPPDQESRVEILKRGFEMKMINEATYSQNYDRLVARLMNANPKDYKADLTGYADKGIVNAILIAEQTKKPFSWQIAFVRANGYMRDDRRESHTTGDLEDVIAVITSGVTPERILAIIVEKIAALPDSWGLIILARIEGWSYREIAESLRETGITISENALAQRYSRAIQILAQDPEIRAYLKKPAYEQIRQSILTGFEQSHPEIRDFMDKGRSVVSKMRETR